MPLESIPLPEDGTMYAGQGDAYGVRHRGYMGGEYGLLQRFPRDVGWVARTRHLDTYEVNSID